MGLAEGGFEFVRLQEQNARAAQEFFSGGVRLIRLQQKNAEFVQGRTGEAVEAEIAGRLEVLSTDELGKVRKFEKQNKNRETLIEQLDGRIRANS